MLSFFPVIGYKRHHLATCHVKNLIAVIFHSLKKDNSEGFYLVADNEQVQAGTFMKKLLRAYGLNAGNLWIPQSVALLFARFMEWLWSLFKLKGETPMSVLMFHLMGTEFTINDAKARKELGYRPVISIEEGLAELSRT